MGPIKKRIINFLHFMWLNSVTALHYLVIFVRFGDHFFRQCRIDTLKCIENFNTNATILFQRCNNHSTTVQCQLLELINPVGKFFGLPLSFGFRHIDQPHCCKVKKYFTINIPKMSDFRRAINGKHYGHYLPVFTLCIACLCLPSLLLPFSKHYFLSHLRKNKNFHFNILI